MFRFLLRLLSTSVYINRLGRLIDPENRPKNWTRERDRIPVGRPWVGGENCSTALAQHGLAGACSPGRGWRPAQAMEDPRGRRPASGLHDVA